MGQELVTVFRSADHSAREDAEDVCDLLAEAGLSPVLLGDDSPGVPSGACEVRVAPSQAAQAEATIEVAASAEPGPGDPSHEFDMETIFDGVGTTAEMEAIGVRAVLEASGIPCVLVGATPYPNLRFLVRVPRKEKERARQALAEAEAAGPAAADEAEQAGEE
jgi:hypothetical protein